MERRESTTPDTQPVYSPTARRFHWLTVGLVGTLLPLGFYMAWRSQTDFGPFTGFLYDVHKLLGFILLWVVVARLVYRFSNGAPPDEPTLEWWQKAASHATHWGLYALLILMPLVGWYGVSLYGARTLFGVGILTLPPLAGVDQEASKTIFTYHLYGGILIGLMIGAHIGAAIFHHFIRKDGVLRRMLPGLSKRA